LSILKAAAVPTEVSSHRISIWLARRSALIHLFSLGSVRDIRRRQHVASGRPATNLTTTVDAHTHLSLRLVVGYSAISAPLGP
jgi:hypothetical protein